MSSLPSSDIDAFCQILSKCKNPGILTGAGLSAASGIETYTGVFGQWNSTNPADVASIQAWNEDPGKVWSYNHHRRDICLKAYPNVAHTTLAALSLPSTRARLLPSLRAPSKPPLHITQNIDGLCRRAIDAVLTTQRGSDMSENEKKLAHERHIEMDGSVYRTICTQCNSIKWTRETPLAPIFANPDVANNRERIPVDQLPRCGGLLGPAQIAMVAVADCYAPVPESQGEIVRHLTKMDVLLVIGTSSLVQPANSYAGTVKKNGGTVAVFNLSASQGDVQADFTFYGPCEQTLPTLFQRLGEINDAKSG